MTTLFSIIIADRNKFCRRYLTEYEPRCLRWIQVKVEEAVDTNGELIGGGGASVVGTRAGGGAGVGAPGDGDACLGRARLVLARRSRSWSSWSSGPKSELDAEGRHGRR
jgi:hypothetical protein